MAHIFEQLKYPIIQGGMAWVSDYSLAAAVSNGGGLGLIASANQPKEAVREQIKKARELTDKPFGVNIMMTSPHVADIMELVCEEEIAVIFTGAGSPEKYMANLKAKGISVIPVIPSVAIARKMEAAGADAVVAEGMEAGGHIGRLTTMALLPQITDAVKIPVVGAGGIADGRGMAAAFMLGAQAVQIGTRFVVAKECTVHQNYKDAIIKAKDIDTTITGQFAGHPVRCLRNKFAKKIEKIEKEEAAKATPDYSRLDEFLVGSLKRATVDGDIENGSLMAGQIAGLIKSEMTAAEILADIYNDFNDRMRR